jgi:hypothetical protein
MTHEDIRDNLEAYVLGGLSPEESAALRRHLHECSACTHELAAYAQVRDGLNIASPDAPLPAGFTGRLLERRSRLRRLPATALPADGPTARRDHARLPWALAAACLVLALAAGGWALRLNNALDAEMTARQQLEQDLGERREFTREVLSLLSRPDLRVRELGVSDGGTRTRLYEAGDGRTALVVFDNLPALPEDRTYQLWLGDGREAESVTTFRPSRNGNWFGLLEPREGLSAYERVGVSVEPKEGSPQPTTEWSVWGAL